LRTSISTGRDGSMCPEVHGLISRWLITNQRSKSHRLGRAFASPDFGGAIELPSAANPLDDLQKHSTLKILPGAGWGLNPSGRRHAGRMRRGDVGGGIALRWRSRR
jgi:hypothetical protein